MFFGFLILARLLFVTCMVFILGYVFGNFSQRPTLVLFTKIASITMIVAFILMNIFIVRSGHGFPGSGHPGWKHCGEHEQVMK